MKTQFRSRLRHFRLIAVTTTFVLLAATLSGCATTSGSISDAQKLLAQGEAQKLTPTENLNEYAMALGRFGQMLRIYKDGDPVIYVQTRDIRDATNLSHPLVGAEIPGDITEMVRTAVNRIGANMVYVPFYPDYLVSQAQLGAKFGVTMPNYLITGALTEFDRALSGAGRSNNASVEFGKGEGLTDIGFDRKRTAILSSLALDLNLVNFSNNQMVPRMQAANVIKVWNLTSEDNASLGFYGDSFGFKLEGKYLQGRHSAIRTLVDLSILELLGKVTNTPYWRCIPNGKPDPVVVENMRNAFNDMTPQIKTGLVQVMLRKYGQPVQITQTLDQPTIDAIRTVYAARFPERGESVDVLNWDDFQPLFFGVPMSWDGTMAQASTTAPVPLASPKPVPAATAAKVGG